MKNNHTYKILLLSEDEKLRELFEQITPDGKTTLIFESSPEEGIKKLQEKSLTFAIVVSEQKMDEMEGHEFLKRSSAIAPDSIRYLIVREENWDDIKCAINHGQVNRILKEPWNKANISKPINWGLRKFEQEMEKINQLKIAKIKNKKLHVLRKELQNKIENRQDLIESLNSEIIDLSRKLEELTISEDSIAEHAYKSIDQLIKKSGISEMTQKDLNRLYVNLINEIIAQMKGFSNQNNVQIELPVLWNGNG